MMKWFVMEVCPRSHPLMLVPPMVGFADLREFGAPTALGYSLIDSRNGDEKLVFPREPFSDAGHAILDKLLENPHWGLTHNDAILQYGDAFFTQTNALLRDLDFTSASDDNLARIYETLYECQRKSHVSGLVWVVLEFDHQLLTRYLVDFLKKTIQSKKLALKAAEAFSVLTTPTRDSFAQKEELALLEIASRIQDVRVKKLFAADLDVLDAKLSKMDSALSQEIDEHVQRFAWLPYKFEGPAWNRKYFLQVLQGLLNQDVPALFAAAKARHENTRAHQRKILGQLQLDEKHRILLEVAQGMVFTKGYRKDALYHFFWRLEPYLKEVAKRLGLTVKQVRRFMPWELPAALRGAPVDADELNARFSHYVQYVHDGKRELYAGSAAAKFLEKIDVETLDASSDVRELRVDCACPGRARGAVKVMNSPEDVEKFNAGDILVAHATNPDVVPAMRKAAAIVTDMGGITCHAAIVSRELKIPCVIDTKIATSVLRDGDVVDVDANHGIVVKLQ